MKITAKPFHIDPAELRSGLETDVLLLEPRSPGLHQSDLIRDLEMSVLKKNYLRDAQMTEEERKVKYLYFELGFMWEICIETIFKRRRIGNLDPKKFLRQVEILHDGVFSTIDAIHIPDWRILEYKLTYRSARRMGIEPVKEVYVLSDGEAAAFAAEFWSWMVQLKGNCLGHETRLASLFVMFIVGTYQPPVPQIWQLDIVFDEKDLMENWRMLKNHEAMLRKNGRITPEGKILDAA